MSDTRFTKSIWERLQPDGKFHDLVRHTADPDQTTTYCSSVDPWHEPTGIDDKGDQVGMDLFYTSGYTRGLPAMIPVSMLYGTPEDSANQIAYLKARGYPISYIEMGEEPDGQFMLPEDYGALYLQWATALHKVDPSLKLGGPIFEGVNEDIQVWPDAQGRSSWLGRFIAYLKAHNRLQDLAFMSFEHYPFEPCKIQWSNLYDEPALISHILQVWRDDGLPPNVPMFITELNISWNSGESFADNFGSLWLADFVGSFLTAGGNALYYFHYIPETLSHGCGSSMGTFSMLTVDKNYQITAADIAVLRQPVDQSGVGATGKWQTPGVSRRARISIDPAGHKLVTAYAVQRPDGQWALMIINKDQENPIIPVRLAFHDAGTNTDKRLRRPGRYDHVRQRPVSLESGAERWHCKSRRASRKIPDNRRPDDNLRLAESLGYGAARRNCGKQGSIARRRSIQQFIYSPRQFVIPSEARNLLLLEITTTPDVSTRPRRIHSATSGFNSPTMNQ